MRSTALVLAAGLLLLASCAEDPPDEPAAGTGASSSPEAGLALAG